MARSASSERKRKTPKSLRASADAGSISMARPKAMRAADLSPSSSMERPRPRAAATFLGSSRGRGDRGWRRCSTSSAARRRRQAELGFGVGRLEHDGGGVLALGVGLLAEGEGGVAEDAVRLGVLGVGVGGLPRERRGRAVVARGQSACLGAFEQRRRRRGGGAAGPAGGAGVGARADRRRADERPFRDRTRAARAASASAVRPSLSLASADQAEDLRVRRVLRRASGRRAPPRPCRRRAWRGPCA